MIHHEVIAIAHHTTTIILEGAASGCNADGNRPDIANCIHQSSVVIPGKHSVIAIVGHWSNLAFLASSSTPLVWIAVFCG